MLAILDMDVSVLAVNSRDAYAVKQGARNNSKIRGTYLYMINITLVFARRLNLNEPSKIMLRFKPSDYIHTRTYKVLP